MPNLNAADADADWALWDNVRQVRLRIRGHTESFGTAQTVECIELPRDRMAAGVSVGMVSEQSRRFALRASQVNGDITVGSEITDWGGRVFYVERAELLTWGTRWLVWTNN